MHLNGATWFAGHRARMVLDSSGVIPVTGKSVVWYMAFEFILPCMRNNISIYLTKRMRRGISITHGTQIYRKSPLCDITSYANTNAFQYIPTARCSPKYLNTIVWNIGTQYTYSSRSRTYYVTYTSPLFFWSAVTDLAPLTDFQPNSTFEPQKWHRVIHSILIIDLNKNKSLSLSLHGTTQPEHSIIWY